MLFRTLFIILLTTSSLAFSEECNIELFSKIYRFHTHSAIPATEIVRVNNCFKELDLARDNFNNKIMQIITDSNGTIGIDFIKRELKKDFPEVNINLIPNKITIADLGVALKENLSPSSNLYFLDIQSMNSLKALSLVDGEQMRISSDISSGFGEKSIKVDIQNPIKNSTRTLWFSAKIFTKVSILKAKKNISYQQSRLSKDDFYVDEILTASPENTITDLNNIEFFKVTRTLIQGSPVSKSDLIPINLINFGTPVNVTLKNQTINLQRTAMPTRSAQFGDIIELKNPNNNKIIAGRVVDFNKVVIEL